MSAPRYFQGSSVQGPVRASEARTFEEVAAALKVFPRLGLDRDSFLSLPKKERDEIKQVPFFVPSVFKESPSKRTYGNAKHANLIFLDIDELPDGTCPAAPFVENPELLVKKLGKFKFLVYHTANSTAEKPRIRIVVDASQIPVALYAKAVVTISTLLGLPSITKESKVAVQAMYLPTIFRDTLSSESPIVIEHLKGRAFLVSDIKDLPEPVPTSPQSNGKHASNSTDNDLENLAPPDPEFTLELAESALDVIDPDIARPDWIKIAAALHHQFCPKQEAEAYELFHDWSAQGKKYEGKSHTRYHWNTLKQTPQGRHPVTIRSLVKLAKDAGWIDPREEKKKKALPKVDAYYDGQRKEFLLCNEGGRWLSHGAEAFKRHLRKVGYSTKVPEGRRLSPAEEVMDTIINHHDVKYAGPLAGRDSGFYDECGVRLLVTDSPAWVIPVKGPCPIILGLIHSLVGQDKEHGELQVITFLGWLKMAFESLMARKIQARQVVALAGPAGCGKSLCQNIITHLFGGRCAKPFRYMSGGTDFNSDLFAAEHLMLEDEQSTIDARSRANLAAHIKAVAVNEVHSCHPKNREAMNMRPWWAMTISLNDEPEAMLVMPSMREDIAGKIILFLCAAPKEGFPTGTPESKAAYWKKIEAEIPAFAQYLLDFKIPEDRFDSRFGILHFHHPELLESLRSLAPETKLLEIIDRSIFKEQKGPWEGTAGELESLLRREFSEVREEAMKLFQWPTACGVYLGKLAGKPDARVKQKRSREKRVWVISPPINWDEY